LTSSENVCSIPHTPCRDTDMVYSYPLFYQADYPRRRTNTFLCAHTSLTNSLQWKILIVDEDSQKLINNVVKEDDILNLNITSMRPPLPW
jgi:hypothetical protein